MALPSTSGAVLNSIADTSIPIDLMIEEEAEKGALRLTANKHWINEPMFNQKGHLNTLTKRNKTGCIIDWNISSEAKEH
jgi:hypothetical protein